MIGEFKVGTIDLSSYNDVTGLKNTATVYWVDGIDRPLPLAQLVMAIYFERAAAKENEVVELMNKLATTTKMIEELANYENLIVEHSDGWSMKDIGNEKECWPQDWAQLVKSTDASKRPAGTPARSGSGGVGGWVDYFNKHYFNPDGKNPSAELDIGYYSKQTWSADDVGKILDAIETKLDSLNTTSQKDMIKLQSETTKRDQTYDLITAMVKSIGGVNSSISSSMR